MGLRRLLVKDIMKNQIVTTRFRHLLFLVSFVMLSLISIVAINGCAQELKLNNLLVLPTHWRNVPAQGQDTAVGSFISTEKTLVIDYDIGRLAGEYASAKPYPKRQWLRAMRIGEESFNALLDNDNTLYITFPREGPANFWAKVSGQNDIDYLLELIARHRRELLAANKLQ